MRPIRLYIDEDSSDRALVQALRARGVDVCTALEARNIEISDEAHLMYATEHGRVLYTFNRGDFYRLHRDWLLLGKAHGGLILAPQQHYVVGEQVRRLLRLLAARSADDMRNWIEFLSAWGE